MIEAALKEFDKRTRLMDKRMQKQIYLMNKKIDRAFFRCITATISVLGTLIVLTGAVVAFSHYFIR